MASNFFSSTANTISFIDRCERVFRRSDTWFIFARSEFPGGRFFVAGIKMQSRIFYPEEMIV